MYDEECPYEYATHQVALTLQSDAKTYTGALANMKNHPVTHQAGMCELIAHVRDNLHTPTKQVYCSGNTLRTVAYDVGLRYIDWEDVGTYLLDLWESNLYADPAM